ncbi:MAG: Ig domain-containing protein, partial [Candidatus Nanoarchaeia archaeon]|nr:Ig domain-containing protein [Candidatus Nanoarchaeia archaeon]
EGDNPLVYSLVTAPSWASIDSNTGIVSGTPTGYSANTPENFIVRAADSKGNTKDQNFITNVTNLGTVSGNVKDYLSNNLGSVTVHLYNATYSQGRFNGLTDGSGNFTIADTVLGGNNIPNDTFSVEAEDNYNTINTFRRPNVVISGDSTVLTLPKVILMHSISATASQYNDSAGTPSFLQFFKRDTGTLPTSGSQTITNWPSYPVSIFLDATNAPTADNELADGSAGSNGVSDYVDRIRVALAEWGTKAGATIFTEVGSLPSTGIRVVYNPSLTGNGQVSNWQYNADGSRKSMDVELKTGLATSTIEGVAKHEFGHTVYNNNHSVDNIYIMYITGNSSGIIHNDEGLLARYFRELPHNFDMSEHLVK